MKPVRFIIPSLLLCVALTAGLAAAAPAAFAADEAAALTMTPPVSLPGKTVKLKATGFAHRELVQLYFDDAALKKVRASRAGKISTKFKVAKSTPSGSYPLKAVGLTSGATISAAFTVKATPPPAITLNPTAGTVATTVTVTGANFKKKDVGTIYFDGKAVGLAKASSTTGGFSITFPVPDDAALGAHEVTAYFTKSAGVAQATFTVQDLPAASLTDNPASGLAGVKVTLTGAAFGTSEAVDLLFDDSNVGVAGSNPSGAFTQDCYVPDYVNPGAHTFSAVGRESGQIAQAAFTVNTPPGATISLSQSAGPPATQLTVTGSNFDKNAPLNLSLGNYSAAMTYTNASGAFSEKLTIPAATPPGRYWVTASGGGKSAQAAFQVRTDWSMFRFNQRHSGYNPFENVISASNANTLDLAWVAATGGAVSSSPAVAGGAVYAGSNDGKLYAFDAATGAPKAGWTNPSTGGGIISSPAVAGGVVYAGSSDGKLYAFDAGTGAAKAGWTNPTTGTGISSSPAVVSGVVYVEGMDSNIYAYDAATGGLKWSAFTGNTGDWTSLAVANGVVYAGSANKNLYAFNASNGSTLTGWTIPTLGGAIFSSPAVANGVVYVGAQDGRLYAFNAATGQALPGWPTPVTGLVLNSSPAVANGVVYVNAWDHHLYAYDAATGAPLAGWTLPVVDTENTSSPAVANGVVFVSSGSGKLYAFRATTGALLWQGSLGATTMSSPAVADGMVYVGCNDGKLYAYSTAASLASRRDMPRPDPAHLTPDYNLFFKP
jgi:outer membrane protein assembly factor BamB